MPFLTLATRGGLLNSAWMFWTATVLVSLFLLLLVGSILRAGRRMRGARRSPSRARPPIPDAWAEAGRRATPVSADGDERDGSDSGGSGVRGGGGDR
ncbi:MAG: hypothetical protein JNM80_14885 [Phycisphaerae bacterium]|nr:hypothetical protein [Phycisphaerae bacterium]